MSTKFIHVVSIVILLFYVLSIVIKTDNSFDTDLGRHIRIGDIVLNQGFVPKVNLFSYTYPDFSHINLQYLFGVFVYSGQNIIGINNLLFIKLFTVFLSVLLILLIVGTRNVVLLLPIGFIFLHLLRDRIDLRPEIFSFLFTGIIYLILNRYESKKTKLIFLLPVIQFIWINFHIYFIIGFILQIGFLVHFFIRKELIKFKYLFLILVFSISLSLVNPFQLDGLLYPFNVFENYPVTVQENQSIFYLEKLGIRDRNFLFLKLSVLIVIISLIVGFLRKTLNFKNIFLSLAGLILGFIHLRSMPYLFFLSFPSILQNFGRIKPSVITNLLLLISVLLSFLESTLYLNGYYYQYSDSKNKPVLKFEEHYKSGLDFITAYSLRGPIFNNFDVGGYIIYRLYPNKKIFIDSRAEAYPKDFYNYEYSTGKGELEDFLVLDERYKFNTIVFVYSDLNPWERNFTKVILNEKQWGLIYLDDYIYILTKKDIIAEKNLKELNLNDSMPNQYNFTNHHSYLRLAMYLLNVGFTNSGIRFVQKALEIFPESPYGNYLIGQTLINNKFIQAAGYMKKSKSSIWW